MYSFIGKLFWSEDEWDHILREWRIRKYGFHKLGKSAPIGLVIGIVLYICILSQGQTREIFKVMLEQDDWLSPTLIAPILSAMILSALLFFQYRTWFEMRNFTYNQEDKSHIASSIMLYFVTILPWVGAVISIWFMHQDLVQAKDLLNNFQEDIPKNAIDQIKGITLSINEVHGKIWGAVGIISAGGLITAILLKFSEPLPLGSPNTSLLSKSIHIVTFFLFIVIAVIPAVLNRTFFEIFKMIDPLTCSILITISLLYLGSLLSYTAFHTGVSLFTGFLAILLGWAILTYMLDTFWHQPINDKNNKAYSKTNPETLQKYASNWLQSQNNTGQEKQPFIMVAAQGGGIYAAAVSSLVLSRIHNNNHNFNHHLFGISAVSGGSVGASYYQAMTSQKGQKTCQSLRKLLLDKHLSPVIGNVPADLIRKFWGLLRKIVGPNNRADALAHSLSEHCSILKSTYSGYVHPKSHEPALILNTTWAGTGHRVAFSPFLLNSVGDGTLWSFADVFKDQKVQHGNNLFSPSVIDAVVTSARFPGALPPLTLKVDSRYFNFGDGGYSDASGVTTAFEIFEKVKLISADKVNSKLLMITFDYKDVNPKKAAGTMLVDTWASVQAILGVRSNLTQQSITRTLKKSQNTDEILQVSISPELYGIPLGWRLSEISYNILSLLAGRPEWCKDKKYKGKNPIIKNSCATAQVVDMLPAAQPS